MEYGFTLKRVHDMRRTYSQFYGEPMDSLKVITSCI